jgi:hypothetical protein
VFPSDNFIEIIFFVKGSQTYFGQEIFHLYKKTLSVVQTKFVVGVPERKINKLLVKAL